MVPMRSNSLLRAGPGVWGEAGVIGFTLVERIRRDGKSISREIIPYTEALQAIEAPRGEFAGLAMDASQRSWALSM